MTRKFGFRAAAALWAATVAAVVPADNIFKKSRRGDKGIGARLDI
jgi:hypothetical protein